MSLSVSGQKRNVSDSSSTMNSDGASSVSISSIEVLKERIKNQHKNMLSRKRQKTNHTVEIAPTKKTTTTTKKIKSLEEFSNSKKTISEDFQKINHKRKKTSIKKHQLYKPEAMTEYEKNYHKNLYSKQLKEETPQKTITLKIDQIQKLRFSQMFINPKISSGETLDQLKDSIKNHGWLKENPIKIVQMQNSQYTCLDNRRLFVLKQIMKENPRCKALSQITATVYNYKDQAPPKLIGAVLSYIRSNENEQTMLNYIQSITKPLKIPNNSYGFCVYTRMYGASLEKADHYNYSYQVQKKDSQERESGFSNEPRIMKNAIKQQLRFSAYQKQ